MLRSAQHDRSLDFFSFVGKFQMAKGKEQMENHLRFEIAL
jgi:hypothetical protein